jgi:tetratricopeptide (TPR) repeat protein
MNTTQLDIANQLFEQGKLAEAAAAYREAYHRQAVANDLADTLDNGDTSDAAITPHEDEADSPDLSDANQLFREGKLDAAIAAYRQAYQTPSPTRPVQETTPQAFTFPSDLAENANQLFHQGELGRAANAYRAAHECCKRGEQLTQSGQMQEAQAAFRQALQYHPQSAAAAFGLGKLLTQAGQTEDALACLRQAVALKPDVAEYQLGLAQVLEQQEHWDEAVGCYRQAIEQVGESGALYFGLGKVLARLQQWEEALSAYERAVELGFDKQADWEEAVSEFTLLARVMPSLAGAQELLSRAKIRRQSGFHEKAPLDQSKKIQPPSLNILFVLYGNMDSNGGYHIQQHAARLMAEGMDCLFAVPDEAHISGNSPEAQRILPFSALLAPNVRLPFANGRGADILHAWTPRELVCRFVQTFRKNHPCPLIIHLEDNEEYLTEITLKRPFTELARLPETELDKLIPAHRYHPVKGRAFLEQADGLSLITDSLERFNTRKVPTLLLPPPVDERLFYPRPLNLALRRELGIPDNHVVLAYTGNIHPGNLAEVRELYQAVDLLNQQDCPTTLLRTGLDGTDLGLESWNKTHEKHPAIPALFLSLQSKTKFDVFLRESFHRA